MNAAISTLSLVKSFKSYKKAEGFAGSFQAFFKRDFQLKNAVDDFDLSIKPGEIIGLLGPNGAGKTTLMKMFTGIIVPSSGELLVLGHKPWEREKAFRKKIALVMGQKSQLWWDIPAIDSFRLLQRYYEIDAIQFQNRIKTMSELLKVTDLMHVQVRKLSLGERMKLELMASLLHNPEIIFLDEPTIGLDLVAQESIRSFIKRYHAEHGATIIITSHYMADVQALCERLVLIFSGAKAFDGPIGDFEKILGQEKNVTFEFGQAISRHDQFLDRFFPQWNEAATQVDIRISQEQLREVSLQVLQNYPVIGFQTEKMPIERVMKTLMNNPELLNSKVRQ